jgi:hypothetical protein
MPSIFSVGVPEMHTRVPSPKDLRGLLHMASGDEMEATIVSDESSWSNKT